MSKHTGDYLPRSRFDARAKASAIAYVKRYGFHVGAMAAAAGCAPSTMRAALREDEEFADAVEEARGTLATKIVEAFIKRGIDGVVGKNGETVYDSQALRAFAAAHDPERFGIRRVEVKSQSVHRLELPDVSSWPIEAVRKMKEALALVAEVERSSGVPALPAPSEVPVDVEFEETDPSSAPVEREAEDDGDLPEE